MSTDDKQGTDVVVRLHPPITGAGGGGKGGGGGIKEKRNTARSLARAKYIDLISMGPVYGPNDPDKWLQDYRLAGVPFQNPNGENNFVGSLAYRLGTQAQEAYPGFDSVDNEVKVGASVDTKNAITRTITNTSVTAARIRLRWPSGLVDSSSGKRIKQKYVGFRLSKQSKGGGFVPFFDDGIYEKTGGNYERDYYVALTGGAPYDIRVERTSSDNNTQLVQDAFEFEALTEMIERKLRYPLHATIAGEFNADQFGNLPARAVYWKGILCQIPTNYDGHTHTYATSGPGTTNGVWDGTFKLGWCEDPAWIMREIATNRLWGMGQYVNGDQLNKWVLYAISRYCNELVDDGKGGKEPRWTMYAYLQQQQDAWDVLDMASQTFRGFSYWTNGQVSAVADQPKEPVHIYTNANVVGGQFNREGTAIDTRFTRVIAFYNSTEDIGARLPVVVDDHDRIARYGVIAKNVDCYTKSPGQAARVARAMLATNAMETELINFGVGQAGTYRNPGDVVEVFDNARAKTRRGGRLLAGTTTSVTLDGPVTIVAGIVYTMTLQIGAKRVLRAITNTPGTYNVINLKTALEEAPDALDTVWILNSDEIPAETFRILSVHEGENGQHEMVAMTYAAQKYPYIDKATPLPARKPNSLLQRPDAPENIQAIERLYRTGDGNTRLIQAMFSWDHDKLVTSYQVTLSSADEPPVTQTVTGPSLTMLNIEPGLHTLTVVAMIGALRSSPTERDFVLDGSPDPLVDFTADNTTIRVNQSVKFTDITGSAPDRWTWDFGDGTATSNLQNPTHQYTKTGVFTVTLTAGNGLGVGAKTKTDYITVTA